MAGAVCTNLSSDEGNYPVEWQCRYNTIAHIILKTNDLDQRDLESVKVQECKLTSKRAKSR